MRISRDKLNKLAHVVADTLADLDECEFQEDRNTVRQEARKVLEALLLAETKLDEAARLKISQSIPGAPARLEAGATTPQADVPAPAAAAPKRAGAWAVQVAAMGSQADAVALRDKLRANGFDGFVDSVNAGGKRLWRVRAGPQTQRSDAVSLRDQIKAKLGLDGNVVSAN